MDTIFVIIIIAFFVYGALLIVNSLFESRKCVSCGYYGPREYMDKVPLDNGKNGYAHRGCQKFPLKKNVYESKSSSNK
jgi:hypothetical protein